MPLILSRRQSVFSLLPDDPTGGSMDRKRSAHIAAVLGVILAAGQLFGMGAARASHENCVNEPIAFGGDDFSVQVGPGILLVGVDKGDQATGTPDSTAEFIVCAQSDVLSEDLTLRVDRGDVPSVQESTGCILAVLDNCLITGKMVVFNDGDGSELVRVQSDGVTVATVAVPRDCIALPASAACP